MNKAFLIGRLGRDPEVRYTASGQALGTLNVPTDESSKTQDGQRVKKKPDGTGSSSGANRRSSAGTTCPKGGWSMWKGNWRPGNGRTKTGTTAQPRKSGPASSRLWTRNETEPNLRAEEMRPNRPTPWTMRRSKDVPRNNGRSLKKMKSCGKSPRILTPRESSHAQNLGDTAHSERKPEQGTTKQIDSHTQPLGNETVKNTPRHKGKAKAISCEKGHGQLKAPVVCKKAKGQSQKTGQSQRRLPIPGPARQPRRNTAHNPHKTSRRQANHPTQNQNDTDPKPLPPDPERRQTHHITHRVATKRAKPRTTRQWRTAHRTAHAKNSGHFLKKKAPTKN